MSTQVQESEPLAQAEELVAQIEAEARQFARSLLARALEIGEDVWAEAKSVRDDNRLDS